MLNSYLYLKKIIIKLYRWWDNNFIQYYYNIFLVVRVSLVSISSGWPKYPAKDFDFQHFWIIFSSHHFSHDNKFRGLFVYKKENKNTTEIISMHNQSWPNNWLFFHSELELFASWRAFWSFRRSFFFYWRLSQNLSRIIKHPPKFWRQKEIQAISRWKLSLYLSRC
jgi:hypothetical protein